MGARAFSDAADRNRPLAWTFPDSGGASNHTNTRLVGQCAPANWQSSAVPTNGLHIFVTGDHRLNVVYGYICSEVASNHRGAACHWLDVSESLEQVLGVRNRNTRFLPQRYVREAPCTGKHGRSVTLQLSRRKHAVAARKRMVLSNGRWQCGPSSVEVSPMADRARLLPRRR